MQAYGQPQQATITHVEVTHDQGDTDRNYSAQLADGQLLPSEPSRRTRSVGRSSATGSR